ncbi:ABC transporter permease [Emticicia sp. W12TSBA100-4]|uniref:ABC transporter permease n=1 Tax=Emticicia sp. W12TSBA100-4 TaxID=3160965 RepID=UPI0033065367
MIRNYLKIAFRNLWKNKLFSFINIMGLGLAIPFALMALMQLQGSFEFDNFHPNSDKIYRIITDEKSNENGVSHYASSPYLLADNLRNNYTSVEKATKVVRQFGWELNNRLKNIHVNTIYVEPTFFEIFGFRLAKGSIPTDPNSLILSQETAQKFFNDSNPIGQFLTHPTYGSFKITGVLMPFKRGTQFRSDVMVSMATFEKFNADQLKPSSWAKLETHTFVKLASNAQPQALDLALVEISKKTNTFLSAAKKTNSFRKQALADISPNTEDLRYNPYVEDLQDIYFNFSIPFMILLLAGFNYTNLTLARSLSRSKEVGVRKVMGALRSQLILQFIAEAILIAFFSLLVGVVILQILKSSIHISWVTWEVENQTLIWCIFIAFTLFVGVLAGSLPAWILSSFQPVKVLKGNILPATFGKIGFRKVLIVIQFVVSLGFIFFMGHFYNQFKYMATENDNFNRKGIFNISLADKNYALLVDEISANKNVEKIGMVSVPFGGISTEYAIKSKPKDENIASYYYAADANFIDNMQLTILAGNNLPVSKSDSATNFVLLNERAVERLRLGTGTPQEAIGKAVFLNNSATASQIVGVVKDFCHFNYQFEKQPVVFQYNPAQFAVMAIRTNAQASKETFLTEMQRIWKKHYPYQQMGYSWFEQELYERYYPAEDMKMMGMAALVIIVIAVMGLLGMVTYSTEKRIKEIGIRKVMGASVWEIVKILSWSFMKLLIWAGIIAIPIGLAESWALDKLFTYYAGLNAGLMGVFFISILAIATFTIGYYAMRAASLNPVKSLRAE